MRDVMAACKLASRGRLALAALGVLLARSDRAIALLEAVREDRIRPTELDSNQTQFLVGHREATVRELAGEALVTAPDTERAAVLESYQPALELEGNSERGKPIFTERCASCHRLGGEGHSVGPDLVSMRNAGRAKMLMNIVDPSQELLPQYHPKACPERAGNSWESATYCRTFTFTINPIYQLLSPIYQSKVHR